MTAFPIQLENRTSTIGYWHIKDANGVLLADIYSDDMAKKIEYCCNNAEYVQSLPKTIEDLKEVIRLMVYPPLTERLRLAEEHAGPFDLIEAKLGKDRLPEQKGQEGPMVSGCGMSSRIVGGKLITGIVKETPDSPSQR